MAVARQGQVSECARDRSARGRHTSACRPRDQDQGLDPLLAPLGYYGGPTQTLALLAGSPALDKGSNALALGHPGGQPG